MAKLIPTQISPDTKSNAERKVFRLFQNMPDTDEWCIIHSVALARHSTQSQGEADFVAVIPEMGVFVLEVKGGGISYQDGQWYSANRMGETYQIKNPVTEANEAMHSLQDFISKHGEGNLGWSLFGFGIVFPDCTVHGQFAYPDLDDLQVADIDDMADLRGYMERLATFWRSRKNRKVFIPHKKDADAIIALLRPEHEFRVSLASQIRSVERQTLMLTDNQHDVFEGLLDNERCLVRGSAGTGKTLLAVACARHWSENGQRVGLFCYNTLLASWLQKNTADDTGIVCDGIYSFMESQVSSQLTDEYLLIRKNEPDRYYKDVLPALFEEALLEGTVKSFDCIVLDEAQDLLQTRILDLLDLLLKGGLRDGNWYFFMDAEKQNLYHSKLTYEEDIAILHERRIHHAKYHLRDNCRNSQAIIEKLDSIFGSNTLYRQMESRGAEVVIRSFRKSSDQIAYLQACLNTLFRDGVEPDDITILSPVRISKSVTAELVEYPVSTEFQNRKGQIFFSTIHSFKGLESPVAILTDFDQIDHTAQKNLLYVGMTRARSALYILLSDKARRQMDKMISEVRGNGQ